MKIKYEPHPVSPERKAELRGQGFKIIDARFDPNPKSEDDTDKPKKRGRPRKSEVTYGVDN